jgi:hypothetical protein
MLPLGNSLFSSLCCPPQLVVPALVVFDLTASVTRIANEDAWRVLGNAVRIFRVSVNWQLHWLFLLARNTVVCLKEYNDMFRACKRKRCCCMPPAFLNFVDSSCLHAEGR